MPLTAELMRQNRDFTWVLGPDFCSASKVQFSLLLAGASGAQGRVCASLRSPRAAAGRGTVSRFSTVGGSPEARALLGGLPPGFPLTSDLRPPQLSHRAEPQQTLGPCRPPWWPRALAQGPTEPAAGQGGRGLGSSVP